MNPRGKTETPKAFAKVVWRTAGAWPRSELLSKGVTELTALHVSPEAGRKLLLV
jgi:hypothetical protein